jgi:hypothetical protein
VLVSDNMLFFFSRQLAEGKLYPDELLQDPQMSFDLRDLFPADFKFRIDVNPSVPCAPLPDKIQEFIQQNRDADFTNIFNLYHLQFIYSELMGPNEGKAVQDHPLWFKGIQLVQSNKIPPAPRNLNGTIMQAIHDFEVSHRNIWQGPLFKKLCDHFIRIYLRIHLAPARESKRMAKSSNGTEKQPKHHRDHSKRIAKAKTRRICDDLVDVLTRKSNVRPGKVTSLLSALKQVHTTEPEDDLCLFDESDDAFSIRSDSEWSEEEEEFSDDESPRPVQSTASDPGPKGKIGNINSDYTNHDSAWLDGFA